MLRSYKCKEKWYDIHECTVQNAESEDKRMKGDKASIPSLWKTGLGDKIIVSGITFLRIGFNAANNATNVSLAAGDAEMFV